MSPARTISDHGRTRQTLTLAFIARVYRVWTMCRQRGPSAYIIARVYRVRTMCRQRGPSAITGGTSAYIIARVRTILGRQRRSAVTGGPSVYNIARVRTMCRQRGPSAITGGPSAYIIARVRTTRVRTILGRSADHEIGGNQRTIGVLSPGSGP